MILNESLSRLNDEELEKLIMIPVWITLLIAGADNTYSKAEIKRACKIVAEKAKNGGALLGSFYELVQKQFEMNVKGYLIMLPAGIESRTAYIVIKIGEVNELFKKLPTDHADALYWSFRDLAISVARSSGGLFGLLSVSYSESAHIDLKMINNPTESKY